MTNHFGALDVAPQGAIAGCGRRGAIAGCDRRVPL